MELIGLAIIAIAISRLKWWRQAPKFRDHFSLVRLVTSCLDDGPATMKPTRRQLAERGREDPNSNPHYIWNEEDA